LKEGLGVCWTTDFFALDAETAVSGRQGCKRATSSGAVRALTGGSVFERIFMTTHCDFKRCETGNCVKRSEIGA